MIKYYIIILSFLTVSCKSDLKKEVQLEADPASERKVIERYFPKESLEADPASERKVIERYFPKESQVLVFDTIISAKELEIKIEQRSTDTYVLNEFETGKDKYRDKYRDFEIGLLIKQRDSTLLDTVLNKMSYLDKSSDIFLNEAIFLNYSFDGISNDSIKFSGGINKPETDWYLELKHSYSIKSKMLELIEWTFN